MDDTANRATDVPPDDPREHHGEWSSDSARKMIDAAMKRLEQAWQQGDSLDIGTLVPVDADPATQRGLLAQLVGIDLEWRWKTADGPLPSPSARGAESEHALLPSPSGRGAGGEGVPPDTPTVHYPPPNPIALPRRPRLEDYAARYPWLGPVEQFSVDLVVGEYYVRRRYGDRPAHAEYLEKFGIHYPDLAERLQAVDREMAAAKPPAPLPPDVELPPGTAVEYFGDYVLMERIGSGGMGIVYKAQQRSLKRLVALKMLLAGQLADEDDLQRFHAEAEAAANLDHPGIVRIFEIGEHGGHHYFSMEFVEGESLEVRLKQNPLPPREAVQLVEQVTRAVAYAHSRGVVHRDLKPANILVDRQNQPRVTDFGLAKQLESDSGLTVAGHPLGTPGYMPPEQAAGRLQDISECSDVYSLGATLYALLSGRPPFQAATWHETIEQVKRDEPLPLRQLNPALPRDLETICAKCLEKDPGGRYTSADELAGELKRFLEGRPIQARPIGRPEQLWRWCKREPVAASLTACAVLAVVSLIVVSICIMAILNEVNRPPKGLIPPASQRAGLARFIRANLWSANAYGAAVFATFLLTIGLRGILTGKPFLIAINWVLAPAFLIFPPLGLICVVPLLSGSHELMDAMLFAAGIAALLMTFCFLYFAVSKRGSFIALGGKGSSLRDALLASLMKMKLPFEETLLAIRLPSIGADLLVSQQGDGRILQLSVRQRQFSGLLGEIVKCMNEYFQNSAVPLDLGFCIFNVVIGLLATFYAGGFFISLAMA